MGDNPSWGNRQCRRSSGIRSSKHLTSQPLLQIEEWKAIEKTFKRDPLFISIQILFAPTPLARHCPGLLLVRQLPGHPPPAPALHGSAPVTLSRLIPSCQARLVTWGRLSPDNLRISSSHKSRLFLVTQSFVSPSLIGSIKWGWVRINQERRVGTVWHGNTNTLRYLDDFAPAVLTHWHYDTLFLDLINCDQEMWAGPDTGMWKINNTLSSTTITLLSVSRFTHWVALCSW